MLVLTDLRKVLCGWRKDSWTSGQYNTWIFPNREWLAEYSVLASASSTSLPCQTSLWPAFCHSTIFLLPSMICLALHLWDIYNYKMTWGKHGKNLLNSSLNKRCCSSRGNVIWQSPNHWNVLCILLNTTKMERLHHAHMTLQIYSQNRWSSNHK